MSLIPQASVALRDMGLEHRLAGVIQDDPVCPPGCKRVGALGALDSETILTLAPATVLALEDGGFAVDDAIRRMAAEKKFQLVLMKTPRTQADVMAQVKALGRAVGAPAAGEAAAARIGARLDEIAKRHQEKTGHDAPRVLLLISLSPRWTALGHGAMHNALLEQLGARNALPASAPEWQELDGEALLALNPDAVVWLTDQDPAQTKAAEAQLRLSLGSLPLAAAKNGRLRAVADPQVLIPSTNLPRLAEALSAALQTTPPLPTSGQP